MHYERTMSTLKTYFPSVQPYIDAAKKQGQPAISCLADWYNDIDKRFKTPEKTVAYENSALVALALRECWGALARPYHFIALIEDPNLNEALINQQQWFISHKIDVCFLGDIITNQARIFWHMFTFEKSGKKAYTISDGLAKQLRDTELRGLRTEDIRLPYESLYIEIPKSLDFKIWNGVTGWHSAEGVYVVDDIQDDGTHAWRFMFIGYSNDPNDLLDDATIYFSVHFTENETLDQVIEETVKKFAKLEEGHNKSNPLVGLGPMGDLWLNLFRWVLNVVMYATWPDADILPLMENREARLLWERVQKTKGPKREKLKQRLKGLDPQRRLHLGRDVVYIDRKRAQQNADTEGKGTGKPSTIVQRVSGHWKRQHYGAKSVLVKQIFIMPYWKGGDGSPIREATHYLK